MFEEFDIVNAILSNKKNLPSFIGIHPALDRRIHDILNPEAKTKEQANKGSWNQRLSILTVNKEEIDNNKGGSGLQIRIPGFKNNPSFPLEGQIFIEYYKGKILVHVWNGEEDPVTLSIEK